MQQHCESTHRGVTVFSDQQYGLKTILERVGQLCWQPGDIPLVEVVELHPSMACTWLRIWRLVGVVTSKTLWIRNMVQYLPSEAKRTASPVAGSSIVGPVTSAASTTWSISCS